MGVKADVELLRQVPLFAQVDPAHLQVMVFSAERLDTPAEQILVKKGADAAAAFLVLSGKAEAYDGTVGEGGRLVAGLERGALACELAMIARRPCSVTVKAVTQLLTLKISNELFLRICAEFPDSGQKVLAALSDKLDVSLDSLRDAQAFFQQARSFSRL